MSAHILLINWRDIRNPCAGGAEKHIYEVFKRIQRDNIKISWVCAGTANLPEYEFLGGIEIIRIGSEKSFFITIRWQLNNLLSRLKPDIVIEFINKLPLGLSCPDSIPHYCFVHHLFGNSAKYELGCLRGWMFHKLETALLQRYKHKHFITGSLDTKEELMALNIPDRRISTLPYGVEVESYCLGEKAPHPTLIFVGRLKKYKRIKKLIYIIPDLLPRFPNLQLHIVGSGDQFNDIQASIKKLKLCAHIHMHGYVPNHVKVKLMQQAWLSILLSTKEGFGLTIPEAACCSTPTIAFDVPGVRQAIVHNKTGVLIKDGDVSSLVQSLYGLLNDYKQIEQLGIKAHDHYSDYTWENAAQQFIDLIHHLGRNILP